MSDKLTPRESLRILPLLETILKSFMDVADVEITLDIDPTTLTETDNESVSKTSGNGGSDT